MKIVNIKIFSLTLLFLSCNFLSFSGEKLIGIKFGVTQSRFGNGIREQKTGAYLSTGFMGGVSYLHGLNKYFHFNPELLYYQTGQNVSEDWIGDGNSGVVGKVYNQNTKIKLNYLQLQLPIKIQSNVDGIRIGFGFGPYIGFLMGGKINTQSVSSSPMANASDAYPIGDFKITKGSKTGNDNNGNPKFGSLDIGFVFGPSIGFALNTKIELSFESKMILGLGKVGDYRQQSIGIFKNQRNISWNALNIGLHYNLDPLASTGGRPSNRYKNKR